MLVLISDSQGRSTFVAVVYRNKLLAKKLTSTVVNKLLKVVKRHLQHQSSRLIDQCTLICFNYISFGTLFFNFQKFWGSSSPPPPPPCPSPCYRPDLQQQVYGTLLVFLVIESLHSAGGSTKTSQITNHVQVP